MEITVIEGRKIVIKGLGKMFYQDGMPIGIAVNRLRKEGIEVSVLHVVDELLKNGWSGETVVKKLREEFVDSGVEFDEAVVKQFCNATYEDQREMIFQFLFSGDREKAKKWFNGHA